MGQFGPTFSGSTIKVLGGGPAGSFAAIAALAQGASVQLIERSPATRHKVCGEFLSPEIVPVLERHGLLHDFLARGPCCVRNMALHIGRSEKRARLPESAFGLSRLTFDELLRSAAEGRGAVRTADAASPTIIAGGRSHSSTGRGGRLFGFKAHFEGPVDDAVELFFLDRSYVGINCIENNLTNVCGLASEAELKAIGFQPDDLIATSPALCARVRPLRRVMKWIFTGPLEFRQGWTRSSAYLAGDALSFVDPFTGSGLLNASITGSLAGFHAARGISPEAHLRRCQISLSRPFFFSSLLRSVVSTRWAEALLPWVPAHVLLRLTRSHHTVIA